MFLPKVPKQDLLGLAMLRDDSVKVIMPFCPMIHSAPRDYGKFFRAMTAPMYPIPKWKVNNGSKDRV